MPKFTQTHSSRIRLIWLKEEGRTRFSKGWQGCSKGLPVGEAWGKFRGAAMPEQIWLKSIPNYIGREDQWEAWNRSCYLRTNERPKTAPDGANRHPDRQTGHTHTDMATLWLNRPSGAKKKKSEFHKPLLESVSCAISFISCPKKV